MINTPSPETLVVEHTGYFGAAVPLHDANARRLKL